ncbi:MAG: pyrimidine reductase family protein, partial [Acidimicrobiia bacterium]
YQADDRPAPAGRPWLLVNMISSLDGAVALDGRSGGLGSPGDRRVFAAVRALADVVLAGAGTVRAEGYRPPRCAPAARDARVARGLSPAPRLAVVSGSLELSPTAPWLADADADNRPIIFTARTSPADRRRALEATADVLVAGDEQVDLAAALGRLGQRGARVVVCEGGPVLNAGLAAHGLVDELCLSLAPLLVGGCGTGIVNGDLGAPTSLRLARLLEEDGALFARYVV